MCTTSKLFVKIISNNFIFLKWFQIILDNLRKNIVVFIRNNANFKASLDSQKCSHRTIYSMFYVLLGMCEQIDYYKLI
jgi:hypothetical protein